MKPFYFISHIQVSNDFASISKGDFQAYLENLKPSSSDALKSIVVESSENPSYKVHEETVLDFPINYVASLSNEAISVFLKHVTGSEVMTQDLKIVVHFKLCCITFQWSSISAFKIYDRF